jgi:phosphoribosylanthranilate isomerase
MTWIKICGITNLEDALVAVEAGADALGFVFYEKSPRNVDPSRVREIVSHLPDAIEKVGVVVNETEEHISAIADDAGLTAVQMHGHDEQPHVADLVVKKSKLRILVAFSMHRPVPEGWAMMWGPDNVHAFVADSGTSIKPGGTGESFDWASSRKTLNRIKTLGNLVVAGGLTPENVGEAMGILHPWGVDVSSGVEVEPGKKDPAKVRAFIKAVREADKANSN